MNVTTAALDPLIDALGQMNLSGPRPRGPGLAGALADSSNTLNLAAPASPGKAEKPNPPKADNNQGGDDELDDVEEEMSYTPYRPAKLTFGLDHPDPVVENSTLAAVAPPDVTYNLALPADIIREGKLSNLQLEAVVYGCQRHMVNLPTSPSSTAVTEGGDDAMETPRLPERCGFLLGMSYIHSFRSMGCMCHVVLPFTCTSILPQSPPPVSSSSKSSSSSSGTSSKSYSGMRGWHWILPPPWVVVVR